LYNYHSKPLCFDYKTHAFSDLDIKIVSIVANMIAEPMNAGLQRQRKYRQESRNRQSFMLAQMGVIAVNHIHNLGNKISGVIIDLNDFKKQLDSENIVLPNISDKPGLEFIENIITESIAVRGMLDTFRNDFNPDRIEKEAKATNVYELIETVKKDYDSRDTELISIELIIPDELDSLSGERGRLEHSIKTNLICDLSNQFRDVLHALLNNSFEARKNDECKIIIHVGFLKEDFLKAHIIVEDNGEGIEQDLIKSDKIFEYRYSTKKNGRIGQGLGMFFVRYYIELFGGQIDVESEKNMWTKVHIILPININ
jgi:signal transduction histidine kinase